MMPVRIFDDPILSNRSRLESCDKCQKSCSITQLFNLFYMKCGINVAVDPFDHLSPAWISYCRLLHIAKLNIHRYQSS
jgi:hypothetical protein